LVLFVEYYVRLVLLKIHKDYIYFIKIIYVVQHGQEKAKAKQKTIVNSLSSHPPAPTAGSFKALPGKLKSKFSV
jgi:hypothetical protein